METYSLIEYNKCFGDLTGFPERLNHFDKCYRVRALFSKPTFKVQPQLFVLAVKKELGYSIFHWKLQISVKLICFYFILFFICFD